MSQSLSPEKYAELCDLIQSLHDEKITSEELAYLEQWVCRDKEAGRVYVQYMNLYARLHWGQAQGTIPSQGLPNVKMSSSRIPVLGFLGDVFQAGTSFFSRSFILTLLMAIGLPAVVLTILLVDLARQPVPTAPKIVAKVVGLHQAVWGKANGNIVTGTVFYPGQGVLLKKGLAELEFTNGSHVILQGPTSFLVDSAQGGYMDRGTLTASVPTPARGFTINTPTAQIIDLGTNFGVLVEDDGTVETHVFKGEVEVKVNEASDESPASTMRLKVGQAARVPRPLIGKNPRLLTMASAPNRFAHHLPLQPPSKPKSHDAICFAHRGDADPVTEGWKLYLSGRNANAKSDVPETMPVDDGDIAAWLFDNRIPEKQISYLYEEESGFSREIAKLAKLKGWVLRARIKIDRNVRNEQTAIFLRYADAEKSWPLIMKILPSGEQFIGLCGEGFRGTTFSTVIPDSRDRFIDVELRYKRETDDADVYVDGKCIATGFGIKATKPRAGLRFGVQRYGGTAKFALVEWKMLDNEPLPEEQSGGK